jgi:hypothetical protein
MNKVAIRSLYNALRLLKDHGNIDLVIKLNKDHIFIEGEDIQMTYKYRTKIMFENTNEYIPYMLNRQLTIKSDGLISALGKLKEFDRLTINAPYANLLEFIGEMDNEDIKIYAKIPIIEMGDQTDESIPDDNQNVTSVDSTLQNNNEIWI